MVGTEPSRLPTPEDADADAVTVAANDTTDIDNDPSTIPRNTFDDHSGLRRELQNESPHQHLQHHYRTSDVIEQQSKTTELPDIFPNFDLVRDKELQCLDDPRGRAATALSFLFIGDRERDVQRRRDQPIAEDHGEGTTDATAGVCGLDNRDVFSAETESLEQIVRSSHGATVAEAQLLFEVSQTAMGVTGSGVHSTSTVVDSSSRFSATNTAFLHGNEHISSKGATYDIDSERPRNGVSAPTSVQETEGERGVTKAGYNEHEKIRTIPVSGRQSSIPVSGTHVLHPVSHSCSSPSVASNIPLCGLVQAAPLLLSSNSTNGHPAQDRPRNLSHSVEAGLPLDNLNFGQQPRQVERRAVQAEEFQGQGKNQRQPIALHIQHHTRTGTMTSAESSKSTDVHENSGLFQHHGRHVYLPSNRQPTISSPIGSSFSRPKRKYIKKSPRQAQATGTLSLESLTTPASEEMMLHSDRGLILKTQIPKKGRPISKHGVATQSTPTLTSFGVLPVSHPYFKANSNSSPSNPTSLPGQKVKLGSNSQEAHLSPPACPANPQHHQYTIAKTRQDDIPVVTPRRRPGRPPLASTLARHSHTLSQSSLQPGPFSVSRHYHMLPKSLSSDSVHSSTSLESIQEKSSARRPISHQRIHSVTLENISQIYETPAMRTPRNRHSYSLPPGLQQNRLQEQSPRHGHSNTIVASPLEYEHSGKDSYFPERLDSSESLVDDQGFSAEDISDGINRKKRSSSGAEKRWSMVRVDEGAIQGDGWCQEVETNRYLDDTGRDDMDDEFLEGRSRKRVTRADSDPSMRADKSAREVAHKRPHSFAAPLRGHSETSISPLETARQFRLDAEQDTLLLTQHETRVGRPMHGHARSLDITPYHQPTQDLPSFSEHAQFIGSAWQTLVQEVPSTRVGLDAMLSPGHQTLISSAPSSPPLLSSAPYHSGRRLGHNLHSAGRAISLLPPVSSVPSVPFISSLSSVSPASVEVSPNSIHSLPRLPSLLFVNRRRSGSSLSIAYPSPSLSSNASFPSPTTLKSPDRTNCPFSTQPDRDHHRFQDQDSHELQEPLSAYRRAQHQHQLNVHRAEDLGTNVDCLSKALSLPAFATPRSLAEEDVFLGANAFTSNSSGSGSSSTSMLDARTKPQVARQIAKRTARKGAGPFLKKHQILQQQLQQMQREHDAIEFKLAIQQRHQQILQQQRLQSEQPQLPLQHLQQQGQLRVLQQRQFEIQQRQQRQEAELEKQHKRQQSVKANQQGGRPKDDHRLNLGYHPQQPQPGRPPKQRVLSRSESASSSTVQNLLQSPRLVQKPIHPSLSPVAAASQSSALTPPSRRRQIQLQPILLHPVVLPHSSSAHGSGASPTECLSSATTFKSRHSPLYHNVPPPGQPLYRSLHAPYLMSPSSLDLSTKTTSSSPLSSPTTVASASPTTTLGRNAISTLPEGSLQQQRQHRRSWVSTSGVQDTAGPSSSHIRYDDKYDEHHGQPYFQQQLQHVSSTALRRSLSRSSSSIGGRIGYGGGSGIGQRQATPFSSLPPTYHSHHRHTASLSSLPLYHQQNLALSSTTSLESLPEVVSGDSSLPPPPRTTTTPRLHQGSATGAPLGAFGATPKNRYSPINSAPGLNSLGAGSDSHVGQNQTMDDERDQKTVSIPTRPVRTMPTPSTSYTSLTPGDSGLYGGIRDAEETVSVSRSNTSSSSDESVQLYHVRTPPADN
ncbi:hypothetical protein BG004_005483 [Podila humilis]|nr:hypothetical protein BG004_005483 [Podila humilis]